MVLDSVPRIETFDWVENVSIRLITMVLATLFDFPFEERSKHVERGALCRIEKT